MKRVKKKEGGWLEEGRGRREEGRNNWKDQYGQVKKCLLCQSEWHLARVCPRRGAWKRREKKEEREKEMYVKGYGRGGKLMEQMKKVENIYVGKRRDESERREEEVYQDMHAIVDTGCERSVIGER